MVSVEGKEEVILKLPWAEEVLEDVVDEVVEEEDVVGEDVVDTTVVVTVVVTLVVEVLVEPPDDVVALDVLEVALVEVAGEVVKALDVDRVVDVDTEDDVDPRVPLCGLSVDAKK